MTTAVIRWLVSLSNMPPHKSFQQVLTISWTILDEGSKYHRQYQWYYKFDDPIISLGCNNY